MDWTIGIALLPMLLCGIMMFGGTLLAAVGLKRAVGSPDRQDSYHEPSRSTRPGHPLPEVGPGREPIEVGTDR